MYENFNARHITCSFHMLISSAMLSFSFNHFLCFRNFNYLNFKAVFNEIFTFIMRSHEKSVNKLITFMKQSLFISDFLCQRNFSYKIFNAIINEILHVISKTLQQTFQKHQKKFICKTFESTCITLLKLTSTSYEMIIVRVKR